MAQRSIGIRLLRKGAEAHWSVGNAFLVQKRYSEAAREFRKALEQNPKMVPALISLGDTYLAQEATEEALQAYEAALILSPKLLRCHFKLAELHSSQKKYDAAVAAYRAILAIDSKIAIAHLNLGINLAKGEKYNDAEKAIQKAIDLNPRLVAAHIALGDTYSAEGLKRAAVECYQKAVALDPKHAPSYTKIGDVCLETHQPLDALTYYQKAISAIPLGSRTDVTKEQITIQQGRVNAAHQSASVEQTLGAHEGSDVVLPEVRLDLNVLPHKRRQGGRVYLLHDPLTDRVFELTEAGHYIFSLLDGRTSLNQLRVRYQTRYRAQLPFPQLNSFVNHLQQFGLLTDTPDVSEDELDEISHRNDPIVKRIVIIKDPDRFFLWLAYKLRWCFTRRFVLMTIVMVFCAVLVVLNNWTTYVTHFDHIWGFANLGWLAVVGLVFVMIPREFVMGAACKHYGGVVNAAGVSISRLRPKVFVDVTSIRWLSKSRRLRVIFARAYASLVIWAAATIAWWLSWDSDLSFFWLLVSAAAGWSALWSWNPAMPRDGYRLLSTWMEIAGLRARAMRALGRLLLLWDWKSLLTNQQRLPLVLYSIGAWTYMVSKVWLIFESIGSSLMRVVGGWGAVITSLVIAIMWLPASWLRALKRSFRLLFACGARSSVKLIVRLSVMAVIAVVLFLPYRYETGGPFKILPQQKATIHAEVEGRIEEVMVTEGQWVSKGQPLAVINQEEYEKNLKVALEQLAEAEAQMKLLLAGPKPEDVEKAEKQVLEAQVKVNFSGSKAERYRELYNRELISRQEYEDVMQQKEADIQQLETAKANLELVKSGARQEELEAKEAEIRRLQALVANSKRELALTVLRAPVSGSVVTPYIDQKAAQYLKKGDQFAEIHNFDVVQVEIYVWEGEASEVREGAVVRATPWSYPTFAFDGFVLAVAPAATTPGTDAASVAINRTVVRVLANLPNSDGFLKSEMTGYAKIETETRPVWDVIVRRLVRWVNVVVWYWIP